MAKKKNKAARVAGILVVLALIAAGVAGVGYFIFMRAGIVGKDTVIYIPRGTTYEALIDTLSTGDRVKNIARFDRMARAMKLDQSVKPGRYQLRRQMSARSLASTLRNGAQAPVNLKFNNIRTLPQFAGRLAQQIEADSVEICAVLLDPAVAESYGFTQEEFIGMFIPNTYQVYWTVAPADLLDRLKREYDAFWTDARVAKLDRINLSRKEVATLASIVNEETNMSDEMPTIAGVYINRLGRSMLLQADPTVKFAVGDPTIKRVLYRHLEVDSPYNTYMYKGLPPGPIRMPSIRAIDAVLDYKKTDYLYFCAKDDFSGYHAFARTLAEHNRNAKAYANALNRAGIR